MGGVAMKSKLHVLFVGWALAPALAFAGGSGTLYHEGKAIALKDAYAFRMPDPFGDGKEITRIVFSDRAIDAAALKDAQDRDDALDAQLRGANRVDLNLEADGSVQNVNLHVGDTSGSQSGSGWYTLDLKRNDAKHVEGRFYSNDESDKKDGHYYDLSFALDLPGAADLGAALPADGGEPAKAYRAYVAALTKGDVDALAKHMSKARAQELIAHRNDPDFKMMFSFIQGQALHDARYVSGNAKGDAATVVFSGKDGDGNATTNTISMLREDGAWKVEKESSKTTVH
jgi:hypothetical protein